MTDDGTGAARSASPGLLNRVVGWLRAGYPAGVPEQDYIPLLSLLRRRLTDDEVTAISKQLMVTADGTPNRVDIGVGITRVTGELPAEDDLARVRARLTAGGDFPED